MARPWPGLAKWICVHFLENHFACNVIMQLLDFSSNAMNKGRIKSVEAFLSCYQIKNYLS